MLKTALGYYFIQVCVVGLVLNICVLLPLVRLALKPDKQAIHLIATFTIANDILNLLVNVGYTAPSIITSSYIVSDRIDGPLPVLFSSTARFTWHMTTFIMVLMATNRIAIVVFNKVDVFTKQRVLVFFASAAVASVAKLLLDNFVLPCCVYLIDHKVLGYSAFNPNHQQNIADLIDSPVEIAIFLYTIVAYVTVFVTIRKTNSNVEQAVDSKFHQKQRAKERAYVVQFSSVSLFAILSYISLRAIPLLFGDNCPECNIIVPTLYTLDCCANGCIYIFLSPEVRNELLKRMCKDNSVQSTDANGNPIPAGLYPEQLQYI